MSDTIELQKIVGQVAAAYFSNSHVSPAEIPTVINQIATSLGALGAPAPAPEVSAEPAETPKATAAQIRKSITPDALISFEDNKRYKTLRRHLAGHGLTPDEYKAKWGLPKDYPMVAPAYSQTRSAMAKALGFGSRASAQPAPPQPARPAAAEPAPKRQTRPRRPAARKAKATAPGGGAE